MIRGVTIDIRPLRHGPYRRLFIGTASSLFGSQFTAVAVPVQMFQVTHSSLWIGYLGAAGLVPLLVFALWGGALADAFDRRRLLLASSLVMWVGTLGLVAQALLLVRSPILLLALVAVQSAGVGLSSPARSAIIPRLVPVAEVPAANTLNYTVSMAGAVIGPLAAGALIPLGVGWAYAVDAATFTVALWAALRLPALPVAAGTSTNGGFGDILFGLRYLAVRPVLLLSFVVDIAAMALALPRALFPAVAVAKFGGTGAVGALYAAIAFGSVVAGLTSGWLGRVRRQGVALVGAVILWGIAVAGAGRAPRLWQCVALLAVAGGADLVSAVYRQSILQTAAPDELRGRMQGVFYAVVAGGPRLGDLRAGAMGSAWGTQTAWVSGGLMAALVAATFGLGFPALRRYRAPVGEIAPG